MFQAWFNDFSVVSFEVFGEKSYLPSLIDLPFLISETFAVWLGNFDSVLISLPRFFIHCISFGGCISQLSPTDLSALRWATNSLYLFSCKHDKKIDNKLFLKLTSLEIQWIYLQILFNSLRALTISFPLESGVTTLVISSANSTLIFFRMTNYQPWSLT